MWYGQPMKVASRDPAAWITADRAVQAAHDSGDVLTEAAARRVWAIVLRRAGHTGTALPILDIGDPAAVRARLDQRAHVAACP